MLKTRGWAATRHVVNSQTCTGISGIRQVVSTVAFVHVQRFKKIRDVQSNCRTIDTDHIVVQTNDARHSRTAATKIQIGLAVIINKYARIKDPIDIGIGRISVDQCAADMSIDMLRGKYAVGAVDLAETTDLCCASILVPIDGKLHLFQRYFIAENRIEQNSREDQMAYRSFTKTGASDPLNDQLLQICEGSLVNRKDIAAWFSHVVREYDVTLWKIGADRYHYADFSEEMALAGFPPEDPDGYGVTFHIPFGPQTLSTPMRETRAIFADKGMIFSRHNGLFRWCVTNTAARIDANNNIAPDKRGSRARIDGYASYLMAYIAYKKVEDDFKAFQP